MDGLPAIPVRMSVVELLAWNPGGPMTWQLVDGVPQPMVPPNRTHGTLQAQLARLIGNFLVGQGGPCTVIAEPGIIPRVQAGSNVRIPDLAVSCSPYEQEETSLTDPLLMIEILSPNDQAETWANVWSYTTIPTVMEIPVLSTASISAGVLRRETGGTCPMDPDTVIGGDLVLQSIGFSTPLHDLYRNTRLRRPPQGG